MVSSKRTAYMILEEVEFLQDGQQAQHRDTAEVPQQHARPPRDKMAPMIQSTICKEAIGSGIYFARRRILSSFSFTSSAMIVDKSEKDEPPMNESRLGVSSEESSYSCLAQA